MDYKIALTILILSGSYSHAFAQVFKCTLDDGSLTFSDKPCDSNGERYEINEAYKPDPSNLNIPQTHIYNQYERTRSSNSGTGQNRQTIVDTQMTQEETAYKCTTVSGKIYYSTTGCGSRNAPVMTPQGPGMTLGKPFRDRQETSSNAEACAWATARSNKGGLSSDERRSARATMRSVCN